MTGVILDQWKLSLIIPEPKHNRPKEMNDLRPVALTSVHMKCLEKILLNHLLTEVSSCLDLNLFADQPRTGVYHALLTIINSILKHLERTSTFVKIVFIDFSSALVNCQMYADDTIIWQLTLWQMFGRSLMYIVNSNGPSTDPCGTPMLFANILDFTPLTLTHCCLPSRYDLSHLRASGDNLNCFNFLSGTLWLTVSKAIFKSKNTAPKTFLLSTEVLIFSSRSQFADSVEYFSLKTNCCG